MPSGFANYDSTSQFHTDVREAIHHYPLPPDTKTQQRSSQKSCLLTNSTPSGKWFKLHTLTVHTDVGTMDTATSQSCGQQIPSCL